MIRHRLVTWGLLFAGISLLAGDAIAGWPYHRYSSYQAAMARRQREINALQGELSAARQILASTESDELSAKGHVASANADLTGVHDRLALAKADDKTASSALRQLEDSILSTQDDDSPFGKAKLALKEAQSHVKKEEQRVLASDEAKKMLKGAGSAAEPDKKEVELKDSILLADVGYQGARAEQDLAHAAYVKLRREILAGNEEWKAAKVALRDTHEEIRQAENAGVKGGLKKLPAKENLRDAQAGAEAARGMVARLEARLRQLGVDPNKTKGKSTRSTPAS